MEFTWSTFVLEIINFLVLVWILKRFLYRPVLDVIAERRSFVERQLAEAQQTEKKALALKEEYSSRLKDWERERSVAKESLATEIDHERSTRLAELETTLKNEKEKARVAEARARVEAERELVHRAMQQGASFAGRLLRQAAGPDLEERLLSLLIEDLEQLPEERRARLREQWPDATPVVEVESAYELSDEQRQRLTGALEPLLDGADIRFRQDETLQAGLRIQVGAWVLALNVRDELKGFAELVDDEN